MKYICSECAMEIPWDEYQHQSDIFCSECGGRIEEATEDLVPKTVNQFSEEKDTPAATTTMKSLLVSCESCSHEFSKRAEACPKCGWKPKIMCQICKQRIPFDSTVCPECGDPRPFELQEKTKKETFSINSKQTPVSSTFSSSSSSQKTIQAKATDKYIGTKWLSFWSYFSLPFGGVLGILMSISAPAIAVIMAPISIFQIITAIGLHYRKMWAWQANWVAIVLTWVSGAIPKVNASMQNRSTEEFVVLFVISFFVFGIIWMWPNYIYWNKRKHLFVN